MVRMRLNLGCRAKHRPLIRQKPGPKKRPEPGQQQAIFSFEPF
jgi:hypothetical protein